MRTMIAAAFLALSATGAAADCNAIASYDRRQACPAAAKIHGIAPASDHQTTANCAACAPASATFGAVVRTASTLAAERARQGPLRNRVRTRASGQPVGVVA